MLKYKINVLEELKKRDKIIIIACHDAAEMDVLADEIIVMETGRISRDV